MLLGYCGFSDSADLQLQQLREATSFGKQPQYLFRDNDKLFGYGVKEFLDSCGIEEVKTAFRSPWQNPIVERHNLTLRRELLNHVIIFNQAHLQKLLSEYIEKYYHVFRPHQSLGKDTPIGQGSKEKIEGPSKLVSFPIAGGLHHRYERVAA